MDDLQVRAAATDIFSYLVEFSPSMVREFVMQEPQQTDDVSISISMSISVLSFLRFQRVASSNQDSLYILEEKKYCCEERKS